MACTTETMRWGLGLTIGLRVARMVVQWRLGAVARWSSAGRVATPR